MSLTDYIVDILLIALIFRQMRARELTPRSVLLPVVLIAVAGITYLHAFTVGGNDLALIVLLTALGIGLGTISGLVTSVWRGTNGSVMARAGIAAAAAWVLGMGFRFAFALYANTASGGEALVRFSAQHAITSAQTWTTALVLMAFGEVLARVGILQLRRLQISRSQIAVPAVLAGASGSGNVETRQALSR